MVLVIHIVVIFVKYVLLCVKENAEFNNIQLSGDLSTMVFHRDPPGVLRRNGIRHVKPRYFSTAPAHNPPDTPRRLLTE